MKRIFFEIDLSDTEYSLYKDHFPFTKDEFVFDNLLRLISSISTYRLVDLVEKISSNSISIEEYPNLKLYIKETIEPILNNFSYTLPLNRNYNSIILHTDIPESITNEELLDIFKYIYLQIVFFQKNQSIPKYLDKEIQQQYNEDIIIYNRLIDSISL